jgi:hypothetical protein
MPVFRGSRYMHGHGFLGRMARRVAMPLIRFIGKHLAQTGVDVASDLIAGRTKLKDSLKINARRNAQSAMDEGVPLLKRKLMDSTSSLYSQDGTGKRVKHREIPMTPYGKFVENPFENMASYDPYGQTFESQHEGFNDHEHSDQMQENESKQTGLGAPKSQVVFESQKLDKAERVRLRHNEARREARARNMHAEHKESARNPNGKAGSAPTPRRSLSFQLPKSQLGKYPFFDDNDD